MLTRFVDFDNSFSLLDQIRRRMDRVWEDAGGPTRPFASFFETGEPARPGREFAPRVSLYDVGQQLVLKADVPGMTEKDLELSVLEDRVSLRGTRKDDAPEGYSVHRRERGALTLLRTFTLPSKVDAEKTTASIKDGVLTVTFTKAAEAQPRQITIGAS